MVGGGFWLMVTCSQLSLWVLGSLLTETNGFFLMSAMKVVMMSTKCCFCQMRSKTAAACMASTTSAAHK